jgi:hypothetical protein
MHENNTTTANFQNAFPFFCLNNDPARLESRTGNIKKGYRRLTVCNPEKTTLR